MILTDSNFEEVIRSNPVVLVDFWADWCSPCRMLSPILDEISKETGLVVAKLNVDEHPIKPQEFSVTSIPTMVLFTNGVLTKTIVGARPKHVMLKELEQWL